MDFIGIFGITKMTIYLEQHLSNYVIGFVTFEEYNFKDWSLNVILKFVHFQIPSNLIKIMAPNWKLLQEVAPNSEALRCVIPKDEFLSEQTDLHLQR